MTTRLSCIFSIVLILAGSGVGQILPADNGESWRKNCPCVEHLTESQMSTRMKHIEMAPLQGNHVNIQGTAVLDFVIGKNGVVQCAHAVSGHPLVLAQIIPSVQKWRFKPLVIDKIARLYCGRLSVKFVVVDNQPSLEVIRPAFLRTH